MLPIIVFSPSSVALLIVTHSLKVLLSPIITSVGAPLYFKSWGSSPIKTFGKILLFLPILVFPSITTLGPTVVPSPIITFGPTIAPWEMVTPSCISAL